MAYETPLNVVPTSNARTSERELPLYGFRVSLVMVITGRKGRNEEAGWEGRERRGEECVTGGEEREIKNFDGMHLQHKRGRERGCTSLFR